MSGISFKYGSQFSKYEEYERDRLLQVNDIYQMFVFLMEEFGEVYLNFGFNFIVILYVVLVFLLGVGGGI